MELTPQSRKLRGAIQRLMRAIAKPDVEVVVNREDVELLLMVKATPR